MRLAGSALNATDKRLGFVEGAGSSKESKVFEEETEVEIGLEDQAAAMLFGFRSLSFRHF